MDRQYNPQAIEEKWQSFWDAHQSFHVTADDDGRKKYYVLEMFPYPSGRIHMGHVRNYTIGDVIARYKAMQGFKVLHPMGWDSFGMPAENAAIQNKTHPATWTYANIDIMRKQLKRIGFSYDWQRELATSDVSYYGLEQRIFLKMLDRGLVYRKQAFVNWCETCQTVLANEQVDAGMCWRCGNEVVQKELPQWCFKTTHYAEELLEGLNSLTGWPEQVITMQRNWIGRSYGSEISFQIENSDESITVFTTRPDTLYGATFMSIAPENPLAVQLSEGSDQAAPVRDFLARVLKQEKSIRSSDELVKEGVFTGSYCINPVTGRRMPVYVANFVLMEYGTGAVMAVPAHDQRDFDFARMYDLDIQVVIQPEGESLDPAAMTSAYVDDGVLVNSDRFSGMNNREAMQQITEYLASEGQGRRTVNYRLKDWGISRQRYWGAPIPVVHCARCGIVPVPEHALPVVLPEDISLEVLGRSPLADCADFVNTVCPQCGSAAQRETDTMDTFVQSSWYFARYACSDYNDAPLDADQVNSWLPVDQYIGGIEHAVMHLLYARFFTKVLRDLGMLNFDEPFANLLTQGMVCMETYSCTACGWLFPEEVNAGVCTRCGGEARQGRTEKMSKSKKNVVDPEKLIKRFGCDTARLFCLFAAPPEKDLEWNEKGVEGSYRFILRLWRLAADHADVLAHAGACPDAATQDDAVKAMRRKTHQTISKVTSDIETRFHFNTAISAIMELLNHLYQFAPCAGSDSVHAAAFREAFDAAVLLLTPMAPHVSEEIWQTLGRQGLAGQQPWPVADPLIAAADEVQIVVQVNGKVRGKLSVDAQASEEQVRELALACEQVQPWIADREIRKVIVVPKKLVSIVV
jgi:leucyl-tRNA synthetase